jgi:DNA-directed RNA polymerase subunit RPC12/RpoP
MKEFKCVVCKEIFESDWSEEDALEEMRENFGDVPPENREVVCDDCYQKMILEFPIEEYKKTLNEY